MTRKPLSSALKSERRTKNNGNVPVLILVHYVHIYISISYISTCSRVSKSLSRLVTNIYFLLSISLYSSLLFITGCTNGCICAMYIIAHIIHMHVTAVIEHVFQVVRASNARGVDVRRARAFEDDERERRSPSLILLFSLSLSLSLLLWDPQNFSARKNTNVVFFGTTTTTTASKQSIDRPFLLGLLEKGSTAQRCVCVCGVSFLLSIFSSPSKRSIYFISKES